DKFWAGLCVQRSTRERRRRGEHGRRSDGRAVLRRGLLLSLDRLCFPIEVPWRRQRLAQHPLCTRLHGEWSLRQGVYRRTRRPPRIKRTRELHGWGAPEPGRSIDLTRT